MREGWEVQTLGEVCQIKPPKKEAKERISPDDLVSFVPMHDLHERRKDLELNDERPLAKVVGSYTYFADNDVLLAKITPCFENGKLGIARNLKNGIGFGSSEYIVFRSKGKIDPEYLFYFLSQDSFRDAGARVMTGAVGHKRVPKEFIETLKIPLPPLAEQKRIVALLDQAFAGIEQALAAARKNLENARELFETTLNTTFTQKGEGWVETTLGEVCGLQNGFAFKSKLFKTYGMPVLRISSIQNEEVSDNRQVFANPDDYKEDLEKYVVRTGDLLIAMSGATTGKIGFNNSGREFLLNQRVGKFEPTPNLNIDFLFYFLLTKVEENLKISAGSAQPNLSTKQIKEFAFSLPSIDAQNKVCDGLASLNDQTQALEALYQQKIDALEELKQSLLQKAFSGELTQAKEVAA